jgi:AraC family transcriptional regulator
MSPPSERERKRAVLLARLGSEVTVFQDAAYAVDEAAGAVLDLTRHELRCVDHLQHLPLSDRALARRTGLSPAQIAVAVRRLELAGYAQRSAAGRGRRLELTPYAQQWIADLWEPIKREGSVWLSQLEPRELASIVRFLERGRALQASHAARIRRLLREPHRRPRSNRRRGGLSPAALTRVRLYVQAHLDRPLPIRELAERAGLSPYHFARAFRATTAVTPRAFVEHHRIERAERLLRDRSRSLAQVALASGFSSQSSFTTAFRRASGFTPAQYRRNAEASQATPPRAAIR